MSARFGLYRLRHDNPKHLTIECSGGESGFSNNVSRRIQQSGHPTFATVLAWDAALSH
jgi:hypothetical protein